MQALQNKLKSNAKHDLSNQYTLQKKNSITLDFTHILGKRMHRIYYLVVKIYSGNVLLAQRQN